MTSERAGQQAGAGPVASAAQLLADLDASFAAYRAARDAVAIAQAQVVAAVRAARAEGVSYWVMARRLGRNEPECGMPCCHTIAATLRQLVSRDRRRSTPEK